MNYKGIFTCKTPTLVLYGIDKCFQLKKKNVRYELYSDTDTYMQDSNANPIWS